MKDTRSTIGRWGGCGAVTGVPKSFLLPEWRWRIARAVRVTQRDFDVSPVEVGCESENGLGIEGKDEAYALLHSECLPDMISATMRPYRPRASAKMRMRITETKSFGC